MMKPTDSPTNKGSQREKTLVTTIVFDVAVKRYEEIIHLCMNKSKLILGEWLLNRLEINALGGTFLIASAGKRT